MDVRSLNHVNLIGVIQPRDPEITQFKNGGFGCRFSIVTNSGYLDQNKKWVETSEWHDITMSGQNDKRFSQLQRGDLIHITGAIKTNRWNDNRIRSYRNKFFNRKSKHSL